MLVVYAHLKFKPLENVTPLLVIGPVLSQQPTTYILSHGNVEMNSDA